MLSILTSPKLCHLVKHYANSSKQSVIVFRYRCGKAADGLERILCRVLVNSLLNDKFLDWFKLKAFADDKINVAEKLKFTLGRIENIVGKGENAGYQHFLFFLQGFQKSFSSGSLKIGIVW